jgi:hypothetical protein
VRVDRVQRMKIFNSESIVLFLEIQTLREASILCDAICDLWSQSDALEHQKPGDVVFSRVAVNL